MNLNTDEIFKLLNKEEFPEEVSYLYDLIFKYKDRVRFVKQTDGITNLLVLSTNNAINLLSENETPHFSIFLVKDKQTNSIKQVHHFDLTEIKEQVELFLKKTEHTLFVQIFFEGSILMDEDFFELYYLLEEENCTINEGYSRVQKLPEYYDKKSSTSEEIKLETRALYRAFLTEKDYLLRLKSKEITALEEEISFESEEWLKDKMVAIEKLNKQILELDLYINRF